MQYLACSLDEPLPNIKELIEDGEATLASFVPASCVALADDGCQTVSMLVRRDRETGAQLLTRLDLAISKGRLEDVGVDEEIG